jgi:hypothetical protein
MIIDSHVHLDPHCRSIDGGDTLATDGRAAGIDMLIISDLGNWMDFPDSKVIWDANSRMRKFAARHAPYFQYLVYLNPQLPDWPEVLTEHRTTAIGIKLWIALKDSSGSLDRTKAVLAKSAELDLPVLLHVYSRTDGQRPGEINLDEFGQLCAEFPNCTMIGAHAGGNWREAVTQIRTLPGNGYFDCSGGYPEHGMVEALVRAGGARRILFGSDAPGRSFSSQLAKVNFAELTEKEREMVLWRNAAKVFKLEVMLPKLGPIPPRSKCSTPRFRLPAWGEDHFCFCGTWPFADFEESPEKLAGKLEKHHIHRAYTVNMSDIFQTNLPDRNRKFAETCAAYSILAPLAAVNPRRFEALAQLDEMAGLAGIWVSPYLHNYALDDPTLNLFWASCAEKKIKIWINTALSEHRFRSSSLAARPVDSMELRAFILTAPNNTYTVQGWGNLKTATKWTCNGSNWRFELSRLGDSERSARTFFAEDDGKALVWGSEYPFRDYGQVRSAFREE